ncbi:hypothetical protein ACTA71_008667 [Dictyostelium dimigraforme]
MKSLLSIVIIILIFFIIKKKSKNRIRDINSKIPGPTGLPLIGNLHKFINNPNDVLKEWYEKYGPIYRIRMGNVETVILTGYPIIKKAIVDNPSVFLKRYEYWTKIQFNNCSDLAMANSNTHSKLKTIVLSEMTATRIKKMEINIILEIEKLCNQLDKHCNDGLKFNFKPLGKLFSLNIVFRFLFGIHYQYDDEKILEIIELILQLVEFSADQSISDFIPIARYFENYKEKKFFKVFQKFSNIIEKMINEIIKNQFSNNENNNNCDTILYKLYNEYKNGKITWDNLVGTCVDIGVGGTDTVSDSVNYSLIALVNKKHCQEKLYNEINKQVIINNENENNDLIIIKHSVYRSSIPYLSMVMKETYRNYPVSIIGLPNITTEDIEVDGYKIAKGTQVFKNIYLSHKSEDFFKSPNDYNPERFLESGNQYMFGGGSTNLLHFGAGSRDCVGKNIADSEFFTLLGTLINRYEFLNPNPSIPLNDYGVVGLTNQSPNIDFIIKRR